MDEDDLLNIKNHEAIDELEIPDELPVLPLRDTVIFPYIVSPLIIARKKSIKLIDDAILGKRIIALIAQKDAQLEDPDQNDLFNIGVAANVLKMLKFPDGSLRVLVQGITRIENKKFIQSEPYLVARIKELKETYEEGIELDALSRNVSIQFQRIVSLIPHLPEELQIAIMNIHDMGKLADFVAANLSFALDAKQEILESLSIKTRLEKLTVLLNREIEVLEMGSKIQTKVQSELGKNQREFYLREQLKAIQKELGMTDERTIEINELSEKIKAAKMSDEAMKEANREIDRLAKMPPGAAEYTVARTYIDWLISLPWSISTKDMLDINVATQVLDEDHYNLKKVKERILEYLAVRRLRQEMKGPILCFVGPPGVGKTSLGKSIARAMGRKFVRISLGGVRDEAEIRGHRRTYIGALPGRIIQGLKNAGSNNPIFMLDEIDKIGQDFRGDPSSALLEVLDPEQNNSFSDHYLDVPFDLSKVMFITTANYLDPIPSALRDRMEVLELPGYTDEEKLQIAFRYLIPKQVKEHGLKSSYIAFDENAIRKIISDYTREAGLRNLEREIAAICRKVARTTIEDIDSKKRRKRRIRISKRTVHTYLGAKKFHSEIAERTRQTGVATGLAWTPVGGEILFVESTKMSGNKNLILTGQLGDVMKESAQAALSYIRSKAALFGIDEHFFDNMDIHIHIPSGAIPKDGPSAGVTMATSLLSLLKNQSVKNDIAMTGEITLRGKVMPVGGIKEKVLAAHRAGIKTIIMPVHNEKDLEDVPPSARDQLQFILVQELDKVFENAFSRTSKQKNAGGE
ncbi:endopeptidase La [candidate division KSB1 bacterium]|nr:endopeptidase La [candidate division KSB1 bacterium]